MSQRGTENVNQAKTHKYPRKRLVSGLIAFTKELSPIFVANTPSKAIATTWTRKKLKAPRCSPVKRKSAVAWIIAATRNAMKT